MPEEWVSLLPRSSRLENEVTNGRVVWIQEFSFNAMMRTSNLFGPTIPRR
jgi:hypothetical protein